MIINLKSEEVIIPEWNDNKQADKPIKAYCKFLSTIEYEDLFTTDDKGKVKFDSKSQFEKQVYKVENLEVVIDGKKKAIKSGKDILETAGLETLFAELSNKLGKLSAVDKKK